MVLSAAPPQAPAFVLDEGWVPDYRHRLEGVSRHEWLTAVHTVAPRPCVVVLPGEAVALPEMTIGPDDVLFVALGSALPTTSSDGLTARITFGPDEAAAAAEEVLSHAVTPESDLGRWRSLEIGLEFLAGRRGRFFIACGPGPRNDPAADWLGLFEIVVCRRDLLAPARARSFSAFRIANERAQFSQVYDHDLYDHQSGKLTFFETKLADPASLPADPRPTDFRSAYDYADWLLDRRLGAPFPDFRGRLARLVAARPAPLEILSLCSGHARIEADLLRTLPAGTAISITLVDLNGTLLETARGRFPGHTVRCLEADINRLTGLPGRYDLILCVSALHHVVELERLAALIADHLAPGGEFWSIGEYIGRNGNRLWPEAAQAAQAVFAALPERLRRNRTTGAADTRLPDRDCSLTTFEGIRSQDIEAALARRFVPVVTCRRNAFLWRLLDLAYLDNYRLDDPDDMAWLTRALAAELDHFHQGGRPTELYGVYERAA